MIVEGGFNAARASSIREHIIRPDIIRKSRSIGVSHDNILMIRDGLVIRLIELTLRELRVRKRRRLLVWIMMVRLGFEIAEEIVCVDSLRGRASGTEEIFERDFVGVVVEVLRIWAASWLRSLTDGTLVDVSLARAQASHFT